MVGYNEYDGYIRLMLLYCRVIEEDKGFLMHHSMGYDSNSIE